MSKNSVIRPSGQVTLGALADRANDAHRLCVQAANAGLQHALEAGEALVEAKNQLPHGAWGDWLRANFRGSHQSANLYMQVARNWVEIEAEMANSQRVGNFSLRGALRFLAEPKAPKPPPNRLKPVYD